MGQVGYIVQVLGIEFKEEIFNYLLAVLHYSATQIENCTEQLTARLLANKIDKQLAFHVQISMVH